MKPKDYVKKYKLGKDDNFDHNQFVQDFKIDFLTLLEVGKGKEKVKGFENAVRALRQKWDGIDKKTRGKLPEKLWKYFYATVIIKFKKELFPNYMEEIERKKRKREKFRKEYEDFIYGGSEGYDPFDEFIKAALKSMISSIPKDSFNVLGIPTDSTENEIVKAYRKLCLKHHPDKGGKQKDFVKITEAKNRCIAYVSRS